MSISDRLGPTHRIELSSGPIAYRERGSGAPIVFVHGVFVNGDLWRKVVPALASTHRCITPDWPLGSHSLPMNPDADLSTPGLARLVAEFLDVLRLEDVTLVGNDTGGAVCQLVMADHSERLGRAVLASCDAFEVFPPSPFGFLRWMPRIPGANALIAQTLRLRAARRLPLVYGRVMHTQPEVAISDSYARPALQRAIRRDAKKACLGIDRVHTLGAAKRLADFNNPALLVWASDDLLFPVTLAERLAAVLPNASITVIDASRTFIGEDRPDELAAAIADFVAGAASQPLPGDPA